MDVQLKRGMLEACVLAALWQADSYGYQIVKDVSRAIALSESTLYPILKRLESANFVTVYSVEHNGRLRKYYHITEDGRNKLRLFQEEWQEVMQVYAFIREETEVASDEQT